MYLLIDFRHLATGARWRTPTNEDESLRHLHQTSAEQPPHGRNHEVRHVANAAAAVVAVVVVATTDENESLRYLHQTSAEQSLHRRNYEVGHVVVAATAVAFSVIVIAANDRRRQICYYRYIPLRSRHPGTRGFSCCCSGSHK